MCSVLPIGHACAGTNWKPYKFCGISCSYLPRGTLSPGHCNRLRPHLLSSPHFGCRLTSSYSALGGSPLQCWDNSTRGLDSATALEFVRTLRLSTEMTGSTAVVAIYQASQSIYDVSQIDTTALAFH